MSSESSLPTDAWTARLIEAWRTMRNGHYEDAREFFTALCTERPSSEDARQGLAWACLLSGRAEEGCAPMTALANQPMPYFVQLLFALENEAKADLSQGKTVPRSTGEALMLSHTALYRKDTEEALRLARRAYEQAPTNGFVLANLGSCLGFEKRWKEAIIVLRNALTEYPTASTWFNVGLAEHRLQNKDRAVDAWHRAVKIAPEYAMAHLALFWEETRRFHLLKAAQHGRTWWQVNRVMRRAERKHDA